MENYFISYSCIFISYIQCFEVRFQKSGYFLKKVVFPEFRLIQSDFRSIKILLKNFHKPLPGSIDRTCFSINRTSWIKFFLNSVWLIQNTFFKSFSNFPLSLRLGKAPLRIFCHFSTKFLQGFSLTRPVKPLYPFFCFYFHDFMHKLMHFNGIFGPFQIWCFCWINLFFWNWSLGFVGILLYS